MNTPRPPKIPESVLVVIHSADLEVLLIERADQPGFWQSVTGSKDALDEPFELTARREVAEETGLLDLTLAPWHERHPGVPFDVDPHGIPANVAKGEPAHVHYDFRYAFLVDGAARLSLDGAEVLGARWTSFDEAASLLAPRLATKLPLALD